MAEQSGFFDAHLVDGEYDRVYLAEFFAKYFASFIGNGIFAGKSSELTVRQKSAADMSVRVFAGQGWINGYWYENTSELSLAIDIADGVLNRIDIVVLRWSSVNRSIRLAVKKGALATNPVAPIIQRDADVYELKLAEISIKAGTTGITQINITDTRLDSSVCGYVHGVVEQLDTQDFGEQLTAFINQFIEEHEEWSIQFKADSDDSIDAFLQTNQNKVDKLITDGQTSINSVVSTGTTNINNLINAKTKEINTVISNGQASFNSVIAELNAIAADNDLVELNQKVAVAQANVTTLHGKVTKLESLFIESSQYPGCFYRVVNDNTEWINPPNMPGLEYLTTERWNGNPVYQRTIYVASLPNKTIMSISVDSAFDKIISVSGFAIDTDNNMYYPFPIILNGLTPAAAIVSAEGDGGTGSGILIQTNEDVSYLKGYVVVKYTKA